MILVVEDNADDSFLLTRQFARAKVAMDIRVIGDGQEALAFLLKTAPRPIAVFLDLHLPGVSGVTILEQIRKETRLKTLPVVVMTASIDPLVEAQCSEMGVTTFLSKPIGVAMFTQVIEHLKATATFAL